MFNKLTDKLKQGINKILPSARVDYRPLYEAEVTRRKEAEQLHRSLIAQIQHTLQDDKDNASLYIHKHKKLGL